MAVFFTRSVLSPNAGVETCEILTLANESPRLIIVAFFFLAFRSCVVPLTAATRKPLRRAVSHRAVSNLHGAAAPVERGSGSKKPMGTLIMSTISKAQCIRAQRVQTTLNHLRATARAVRRAVNPYASLDRVSSLSSVLRDAAANRRFSSFSNFSIEA